MILKNILIACVLLFGGVAYAGECSSFADSTQREVWEEQVVDSWARMREAKGIELPNTHFDINGTRTGYAYLLYDTLVSGGGIYAIDLDNPSEYMLVGETTAYQAWAGALADGKYYVFLGLGGGANVPQGFFTIDLQTGWRTEICRYRQSTPIITAMVYDPIDDVFVGTSKGKLYTIGKENGEVAFKAQLDRYLLTLAMSKEGKMYGVDVDGYFCEVGRQGFVRVIGFTGVKTWGMQSMAFDPNDGTLYWAMWNDKIRPALGTIDLETGRMTRVADMGHGSEWTALVIPGKVRDGVPGAVTELEVNADPEGLGKAVLSWTNPADLAGGKVAVYRDGVRIATLKGKASSYVDTEVSMGEHVYRVVAGNKIGEGESAYARVFVGNDVPAAVSEVAFMVDGEGGGRLTWTPATQGAHGGRLDTALLCYHVYRFPENQKVLTTCLTEVYDNSLYDMGEYYYGVQVETAAGVSPMAYSNRFYAGKVPLPVPYFCNFRYAEKGLWRAIDKQGNGMSWDVLNEPDNFCLLCESRRGEGEDDLILSPPLSLKAGHKYRLEFEIKAMLGHPSVHVTFGQEATAEGQRVILSIDKLAERDYVKYVVDLPEVTRDGAYLFGFQTFTSPNANQDGFALTNVRVEEVSDGPEEKE